MLVANCALQNIFLLHTREMYAFTHTQNSQSTLTITLFFAFSFGQTHKITASKE
jgi:hypothetical protein